MITKSNEQAADVVIVGAGPAGLLSAILLGRMGHKVILVERHAEHYPLPRAVTFDDEAARILSSIGIDAEHDAQIQFFEDWYELKNQKDEVLACYDWRGRTRAGWHRLYWFNQPELEVKLAAQLGELPNVQVMRGLEALEVKQSGQSVVLTCRDEQAGSSVVLEGRYLVGSDGANSLVRNQMELPIHDLGFQFDWLIVDIKLNAPMHFSPAVFQYCDPARPTTVVPAGPGRRRWEFMVLPGETPDMLNRPEAAWQLLARWGATPENCTLERHAVWRFQGRWAEQWAKGRVMLAGDAAHLMPPFAGQGMCAALRDAANLSWKLDLALRGVVGPEILQTYSDERRDHVRAFIDLSIGIGRVVCVTDPAEAAVRDQVMLAELAANGPQPAVDPNLSLGAGIWMEGQPDCGRMSAQGMVSFQGVEGRFDEVAGRGWTAIGWKKNPARYVNEDQRAIVAALDIRLVEVSDVKGDETLFDLEGTYRDWFAQTGAEIILVRPDFYVASATSAEHFSAAIASLAGKLGLSGIAALRPETAS